jgi:peptidyl-prolyl cis-trans isomerase C
LLSELGRAYDESVSRRPCLERRPSPRRTALGLLLGVFVASALAWAAPDAPAVSVADFKLGQQDLQERFNGASRARLSSFGKTVGAQLRGYIDQVLVPELVFAAEAAERKLADSPALRERVDGALVRLLDYELEREARRTVSAEQIGAYYDAHRHEFEKPERVLLWRILVATKEEAEALLAEARGAKGPDVWSSLARDKSLDEATKMRSGNLGFVEPDGKTEHPEVRVSPALFAAARGLEDGAVVPKPVAEGDKFAVVWRRGSLPAEKAEFAEFSRDIRTILARNEARRVRRELVAKLRQTQLVEHHPEALASISDDWIAKRVAEERRTLSGPPQAGVPAVGEPLDPAPKNGESGLE